MDLPELKATLARLGLELPQPSSGVVIETAPPRIIRAGDRGVDDVQRFPSEDALCRYLLVGMLLVHPVPLDELAPDAPRRRPRLPAVQAPKAGFWEKIRQQSPGTLAPTLAWSRELPVHSAIAARGQGLLLLTDTGGLVEHGADGALQLTAVDVATGAERWSLPIWPPTTRRTVALMRERTALITDGVLTVLETATGERLWSRELHALLGRSVTTASGAPPAVRVLAHARDASVGDGRIALLEVGRRRDGTGLLVAVDLTSGRTLWTGEDSVSDPAYAYPPAAATPRLLRARLDGDTLVVTAVRIADAGEIPVATVPVPASYAGGSPLVLADKLDAEARSGLVVVRFTRAPEPGEVGTRLGDMVLAAGAETPVYASAELASGLPDDGTRRELAYALGPDRFVVTNDTTSRLLRANGSVCWSAPPGHWFGRFDPITVHWPHGRSVEAITDDGAVAWTGKAGTPVLMRDRVLWLMTPARMEGIDVVNGRTLWRRDLRADEVRPAPNGLVGWSEVDESVVTLTPKELRVHRLV